MSRLQSCSRIFEKSSAVAEKKNSGNSDIFRKIATKCAHYPAIDFAWTAALRPVYIQCIADMLSDKLSGHLRLHRDKDAVVAATFSASHRGLPSSSFIFFHEVVIS